MTSPWGAPPLDTLARAVRCAALEFDRLVQPPPNADEAFLWRELVGCLVGSAQRFEQAVSATRRVYVVVGRPWDVDWNEVPAVESSVYRALIERRPGSIRPRFPSTHASHVTRALEFFYMRAEGIAPLLAGFASPFEARTALVSAIPGLGPKQASLFLRNIGASDDLAVLDRHVLRYMTWIGVETPSRSPANLRDYTDLESVLRRHAIRQGYSLGTFDRAVWLTVRCWREVHD